MIDLHTHHKRCGHAKGDLSSYARIGYEKGLCVLGLSDHAPLLLEGRPNDPMPGKHMPVSSFDGYLDEACHIQEQYSNKLRVLVGVEADYMSGTEEAYAELVADRRLDYVIGAVHYFGGFHVYDRARWANQADVEEEYERYHEHVRAAAASGLFDILAHIDAVKARAPHMPTAPERAWDATVEAVRAAGVAVEVNTAGLRKCGEPFPAWGLIGRLHAAGVPLTFGSDAHAPEEIAYGWAEVRDGLTSLGVTELAVYEGRRRSMVRIRDLDPASRS